jgi:SAM-dependent methyltransferase
MRTTSERSQTVRARLALAENTLARAGLPAPREDALVLLSSLLGIAPRGLLASSGRRVSPDAAETYAGWIARRAAGEAVPHITGHLSFMDLDLAVGRTTPLLPAYAPRLVEVALERARRGRQYDLLVAEIDTGCGAVALALAAFEPRFARVYALDPSPDALRTATANGVRYLLNLVISWLAGDGPAAVPEPVDLIVRAECGDAASQRFTDLVEQAPDRLRPGGTVVCGLERGQDEATSTLQRALPVAHVWTESQPDGFIVVAQLPRSAPDDAAFDTRR